MTPAKHFLAPDNNIIDPYDSRYYDRFAYALNNPLMNTDPTGEVVEPFTLILVAAAVLVGTYLTNAYLNRNTEGQWEWNPTRWDFFLFGTPSSFVPQQGLQNNGLAQPNELINNQQGFGSLNQNPNNGQPCPLLYTAEACAEMGFLPPDTPTTPNTSGVMTGGSGLLDDSCLLNCDDPVDGDDDSETVPNEEEEPVNPCGTGFVQDINGNCVKVPCPGDPVHNPRIAGQKNSGLPGGIFGTCTRFFKQDICAPKKRLHEGVDLLNPEGQPIYAMFDGMARLQEQEGGAGYHVSVISQVNGKTVRHVYFHLKKENRASGFVRQGDIIGYQGDSGNLKDAIEKGYTQSHVHVKVEENGKKVNPFKYFKTQFDPATGELLTPCE